MTLRYNYNRQVSPPAPFVYVTVARPHEPDTAISNLPAQLDTAADFSAIPAGLVERLQLVQLDDAPIAGFGGHVTLAPIYLVELGVQPFGAEIVRVLADREEPFVLLGRDVLNRYKILLDGPQLIFEIQSA
jgi:hypothetical protein